MLEFVAVDLLPALELVAIRFTVEETTAQFLSVQAAVGRHGGVITAGRIFLQIGAQQQRGIFIRLPHQLRGNRITLFALMVILGIAATGHTGQAKCPLVVDGIGVIECATFGILRAAGKLEMTFFSELRTLGGFNHDAAGNALAVQGRIRIGFTSSAALHTFVPALLRRYREIYPSVSTQLEESGSGELLAAVVAGQLDVAFVRMRVKDKPELVMEKVLEEPMWVAVPAGHRLASQPAEQPLKLEDLSNEPFVLYRRRAGQGLYDAILAAYVRAGFSPHIVQEAPRLTSCLSLVGAGLGISIVPESMTRLGGDGVVFLPLAASTQLSAPLYLARRVDSHASSIINTFCQLVKSQLSGN